MSQQASKSKHNDQQQSGKLSVTTMLHNYTCSIVVNGKKLWALFSLSPTVKAGRQRPHQPCALPELYQAHTPLKCGTLTHRPPLHAGQSKPKKTAPRCRLP